MERVLIVEDSPTQRENLRIILESEGFEVFAAQDGSEGLKAAGESKFDLVISDIVMPGLTGYELCRKLKSEESQKDVPIILLTTLSDPMDVIRGLECGADNFITKPYEPELLIQRVRNVLENWRLRAKGEDRGSGIDVFFLGKKFTIKSNRQQILYLLISTFEDTVRTNKLLLESQGQLTEAKEKIERYAKLLEGKVQFTEEKYRLLLEHATDAVIGSDLAGRIFSWNRGAETMFGYGSEEIVGKSAALLVAPERKEEMEKMRELAAKEQDVSNCETVMVKNNGDMVQVSVAVSPIKDSKGTIIGLSTISRDITEIKLAQESMKKYEEQLKLSQKMDAIGRLAGGVAHDFNNLLSVIGGNSEFIKASLAAGDSRLEEVEEIEKAVQRGAELTRQLLAFGKKQVSQPRLINLNELSAEMSKMFKRLIDASIDFAIIHDKELNLIQSDPGQIQQVILNMVLNARDAMPKGGQLIIITKNVESSQVQEVTGLTIKPGSYVCLSVTDTGIGMDKETQKHLFEPFFTTKGEKGTGLGLATVYGIVNQWNGHLRLQSIPGVGSTFSIYFPVAKESAVLEIAANPVSLAVKGTETILVAEDSEPVRRIVVRAMENYGYHILEAVNGFEAVEKAADYKDNIHLLITDTVMPKMNGKELAEKLLKVRPSMKVLFMSGYPQDVLSRQGKIDPSIHLIQKPFTNDELAARIRGVLDGK